MAGLRGSDNVLYRFESALGIMWTNPYVLPLPAVFSRFPVLRQGLF